MSFSIQNIVVCGAGTMGSGIAQVAALHGFSTVLFDVDLPKLHLAARTIQSFWEGLVQKNKLTGEAKGKALGLLRYETDIRNCRGEVVIEAIIEKTRDKEDLFNQLAGINGRETIFASNTSSLSISEIAAHVPYPERVCGMHFFNPAQVMRLVEVVQTAYSSGETIQTIMELARKMGKSPVLCKDSPGFIVNRVARPYYLESLRIAEAGLAEFEDIDAIMEAAGFRMGPFRLMDLIGNDINLAVTRSLFEACKHAARFKPSKLQQAKVEKGELGRKTGKGYYNYDEKENR